MEIRISVEFPFNYLKLRFDHEICHNQIARSIYLWRFVMSLHNSAAFVASKMRGSSCLPDMNDGRYMVKYMHEFQLGKGLSTHHYIKINLFFYVTMKTTFDEKGCIWSIVTSSPHDEKKMWHVGHKTAVLYIFNEIILNFILNFYQ